mmetsp:Transcript_159257/g.510942  ORF Transcript_159257/g.510942 Transcript_159257/m.510942 type:complete len:195 (+) Transcript_159257:253-837(+)
MPVFVQYGHFEQHELDDQHVHNDPLVELFFEELVHKHFRDRHWRKLYNLGGFIPDLLYLDIEIAFLLHTRVAVLLRVEFSWEVDIIADTKCVSCFAASGGDDVHDPFCVQPCDCPNWDWLVDSTLGVKRGRLCTICGRAVYNDDDVEMCCDCLAVFHRSGFCGLSCWRCGLFLSIRCNPYHRCGELMLSLARDA